MSGSIRRRAGTLLALGLAAVVAAGCSDLPDSGPVHLQPAVESGGGGRAPYFVPPDPQPGASAEDIVRGYLLAMQANPPSTAVARRYLSGQAQQDWKPGAGTVVYQTATVTGLGREFRIRLTDADRLDGRGQWLPAAAQSSMTIPLQLVLEDGEWRIDNPPDVLLVASSDFASLFTPFTVYYFDPSWSVLVPFRVYEPRGEQSATNLVRSLLAGPGPSWSGVARSAFPARTELDLAVVVNDAGLAEVPLGPEVLRMSGAALSRAVVQLAWALRQVPGISALQITVAGAPVALPDGRTEIPISEGAEFDPVKAPSTELTLISGGRVLAGAEAPYPALAGPLGQRGFALRSLARNATLHRVAAVAANGRRLFLAPDRGASGETRVGTGLDGAADLLRPAYDRFGNLWVVDAGGGEATLRLLHGASSRVLPAPGISGSPVTAFTLTPDGSRLVALTASGDGPVLEVAKVVRDDRGRVLRLRPADRVAVGRSGLGTPVDLAPSGPTSVAVLSQETDQLARVTVVEVDGSPGPPGTDVPVLNAGTVRSLVGSADPVLPLGVVTADNRLILLNGADGWVTSAQRNVLAAAYPQ